MYNFYLKNCLHPHLYGRMRKLLLIMKITTLLLVAVILHVSAATSLAQKVTLNEKNVALVDVFNKIRVQTGYDFSFSTETLENSKPVTINVKNEELNDVLTQIFRGQNLEFSLNNKIVTVKPKETSLIEKLTSQIKAELAQVTITGKVTDELGQPMMGVTVKQKGTNNATATDGKGNYTLTVPDDKTIIAFSYIGYETVELVAKDINSGSVIKLKATEANLREVAINKGYYTEKQELSTGDVTVVTAKIIGEQPVSDPIMALEGRVPGLQISQASGIPGANYKIYLRGQNSIANGIDPLYIVDGVPFASYSLSNTGLTLSAVGTPVSPSKPGPTSGVGLSPFNNLNPSDIESIEVLKDADATAIYGSRGANGVILITTKKGKAGQTRVDVDVNSGVGDVTRRIPLLNTQQYLQMRHEAYKNDGLLPAANAYDVNGTWDTTRYTNWQKVLTGNTARFNNANVSISGGNANTQFLLGGGYSKQTTVFPGDFNDQKASAHLSLNHTSTNQKFHAVFSAQYGEDNSALPQVDFTQFIVLAPDAPALYDGNGNLNWQNGTWFNPLAYTLATASSITDNLLSNLNLGYEPLPGLKVQSSFGYTHMQMNQSQQRPETFGYNLTSPNSRSNRIATSNTNTWIIEPQINYTKMISKGKLDVLVGSTIQENQYNTVAFITSGYSSDAMISNIQNASTVSVDNSTVTDYRYNAIYGRINYNWEGKYILNATARRDGSSRFGPGNQFGNFGAAGAAWLFSKEKFVENALPFLSFGKLRASYGTTGSDQIADYQYLSAYSASSNYQGVAGLIPNKIASPYYAWEVTKKLEGGLDLGFLKDRINLSVSVYRNRTGNQLVADPLSSQAGFSSVQGNLPAVVQNAGQEVVLNTVNIQTRDFSWSSAFNISSYRNKLIAYPGLASSPYKFAFIVGQPLFIIEGFHYTGVNPQTGLYTVQDVDNNGVIGNPDRQALKPIEQDYYGGLSNSFNYKGWHLDVFFQFVKQTGRSYLRSFAAPGTFSTTSGNQPIYVLNRWQSPGDITNTQRFTTGGTATTAYSNGSSYDLSIVDASFVRLKNVSLSYTVPQAWQHTLRLQNARIYLNAQNLLTFTGYQGLDPETQGLSLPPLRMVSLGVQASF